MLKLRGSDYKSGEHAYRIATDGFHVFPRLADDLDDSPYQLDEAHTGTGIAALDQLLGDGGYWAGATTLIAGPSGIGKTLMGLHFIFQGARANEPGIIATFQENQSQLERVLGSFGWSLKDPNVNRAALARAVARNGVLLSDSRIKGAFRNMLGDPNLWPVLLPLLRSRHHQK